VKTFLLFVMIVFTPPFIFSAENTDYNLEISRLRKEIAQVKIERHRLGEDIARDGSEHGAYQERTAVRKASLIAETDSIRRLTVSYERQKDSINAAITDLELKQKNFDLLKSRFRDHIIIACKKLLNAIRWYPPSISRPAASSVSFLLNDCTAKNIDNVEALQRFVQILKNLDDGTLSIQTGQETSAIPEIKGNASLLRIGAVFEAIVDEDGKTAAVWGGGNSASGGWQLVSGRENIELIAKAIAVRESKSLPAFIPLPWGTPQPASNARVK
jgi:hypothetical protein